MKVLRSIKPYWVYLILEGLKTIEVGKNVPHSDCWDRSVIIYCSKDMRSFRRIPKEFQEKYRPYLGKVVGEFKCQWTETYPFWDFNGEYNMTLVEQHAACLDQRVLLAYGNGADNLYGWPIRALEIYEEQKGLGAFYMPCKWYEKGEGCGDENCPLYESPDPYYGEVWNDCEGKKPIIHPPQSWCYVEDLC